MDVGPAPPPDLASLYARQRGEMVRLARLLTGSTALAEEVVQEAFLKLQGVPTSPRNPEAYLRIIVTNISRSQLRRIRLARRLPPVHQTVSYDPEVDETWAVLRRLPFRQRAVLTLRFYEDLPEADIALILNCRLGTVKSTLHRGLSKMRRELS